MNAPAATRAASARANAAGSKPTDTPVDDRDAGRALLEWQLARRAVALALADPAGLGGVALHGRHGPARDALLAALPAHGPVRRIPSDADDDALLGGLDTTATLAAGRPVRRPGLLDATRGETLLLGGAERLSTTLSTRLRAWLDDDAHGRAHAPLVALDESLERSGLVESALGERLALHANVPELALAELRRVTADGESGVAAGASTEGEEPARAPRGPTDVALPDETLEALVRLAARLGIDSLRSALLACRAARANAWLDGRDVVNEADAALAAQLVLAPRARVLPGADEPSTDERPDDDESAADGAEPAAAPDEASADTDIDEPPADDELERPDGSIEPPPAPENEADDPDRADEEPAPDDALPERLVAAVAAALPRNLLDELVAGRAARDSRAGGDARASAAAERGGRPIGTRRPRGGKRQRPNLVATLKAAIPWQRLRATEADTAAAPEGADEGRAEPAARGGKDVVVAVRSPTTGPRLRVRREDFRVTRYRRPVRTTTLFVVDASGSAAMHRLGEAKGAVEGLLAECYVRRDRVALITFRGEIATLDLPPTRSLVRAKRALIGLPGGGGTPLAAGLDLAADQLERLAADGESPVGVVMTDGRANVARDGGASRTRAQEDAEAAARRLARIGVRLLFVDTGPRPRPAPRQLAALMNARYLPLPQLDTATLAAGGAR